MVFYRKYRPQKLKDVIGQEQVTDSLLSQLESGQISHAYLFSGPRGTGKTSTARIFAKAINCLSFSEREKKLKLKTPSAGRRGLNLKPLKFGEPCNKCQACLAITNGSSLDLIEIDAASNRGIDDVRDLREKIKLSPVSLRFKVYIVDEAHMLTSEAFNALLKTLEEPPAHAVFILCTTDFEKLPSTIVSRCQRLEFNKAKPHHILESIKNVITKENLKVKEEILVKIAQSAGGSFRDPLTILDQIAANKGKSTIEQIEKMAQVFSKDQVLKFLNYLSGKNARESILMINEISEKNFEVPKFIKEAISLARLMLLYKIGVEFDDFAKEENFKKVCDKFSEEDLEILVSVLSNAVVESRNTAIIQLPFEIAIVKFAFESRQETSEIDKTPTKDERVEIDEEEEKKPVNSPEVKTQIQEVKKSKLSKSANGNLNLADIKSTWPMFLKTVRSHNVTVEALLRSCVPVEVNKDKLVLEAFYKFHKSRLEDPKVNKILTSSLLEVFKTDFKVFCVLGQKKVTNGDEIEKIVNEVFK